jgi:hypothetical protein
MTAATAERFSDSPSSIGAASLVFVDSNVLLYAVDDADRAKRESRLKLVRALVAKSSWENQFSGARRVLRQCTAHSCRST